MSYAKFNYLNKNQTLYNLFLNNNQFSCFYDLNYAYGRIVAVITNQK